jgi:hypothetical protein
VLAAIVTLSPLTIRGGCRWGAVCPEAADEVAITTPNTAASLTTDGGWIRRIVKATDRA